jgi:drug/metabolite transporter (DMT)-like permease
MRRRQWASFMLVAGAIGGLASPSALSALGVVVVAVGIVLVRGLRATHEPRDLVLALAIGAFIASYTLIDKHGVTHGNPFAYLEVVFSITSFAYLAGALKILGAPRIRAAIRPSAALAGIGFFGSYGLTLAALRLASAASVAAVRESSVVIAAIALVVLGREPLHGSRLAGAGVVAAGVALVSLG